MAGFPGNVTTQSVPDSVTRIRTESTVADARVRLMAASAGALGSPMSAHQNYEARPAPMTMRAGLALRRDLVTCASPGR
jgi:hypothetical protein